MKTPRKPDPNRLPLEVRPLSWPDCQDLAPRLTRADAFECLHLGQQPLGALATGLMFGNCWCVYRAHTGRPVGAFGFTADGVIWSLWTSMGLKERKTVLKETPGWVLKMVEEWEHLGGVGPLKNHIAGQNKLSIAWLKATRCFHVSRDAVWLMGEDFYPFHTHPAQTIRDRAQEISAHV